VFREISLDARREVPDTINVTFEYPDDLLVIWRSTFSNGHYDMGQHYLGKKGTVEHTSGKTVEVKDVNQSDNCINCGANYFPEKTTNPDRVVLQGSNPGGITWETGSLVSVIAGKPTRTSREAIWQQRRATCRIWSIRRSAGFRWKEAMAAKPEALV
jgi:hypothetical protein